MHRFYHQSQRVIAHTKMVLFFIQGANRRQRINSRNFQLLIHSLVMQQQIHALVMDQSLSLLLVQRGKPLSHKLTSYEGTFYLHRTLTPTNARQIPKLYWSKIN